MPKTAGGGGAGGGGVVCGWVRNGLGVVPFRQMLDLVGLLSIINIS